MFEPGERQPIIAVCGAGRCDAALAAQAALVGRGIALAGAILVCGGLGGVMAAACRGARSAGGLTVGIPIAGVVASVLQFIYGRATADTTETVEAPARATPGDKLPAATEQRPAANDPRSL